MELTIKENAAKFLRSTANTFNTWADRLNPRKKNEPKSLLYETGEPPITKSGFNLATIADLFINYDINIDHAAAFAMLLRKIERVEFGNYISNLSACSTPQDMNTFIASLHSPKWIFSKSASNNSGPIMTSDYLAKTWQKITNTRPLSNQSAMVEQLINLSYVKAYEEFNNIFESYFSKLSSISSEEKEEAFKSAKQLAASYQ